jgi:hypothetical protein
MCSSERDSEKENPYHKVVYGLLYPGVLGSMLFDIFDPVRINQGSRWMLAPIGLAFIADFWHLNANLEGRLKSTRARQTADLLIATGFTLGYFIMSYLVTEKTNYQNGSTYLPESAWLCVAGLSLLSAVHLGIALYEIYLKIDFPRLKVVNVLPTAVCVAGFFSLRADGPNKQKAVLSFYAIAAFFYIYYVAGFSLKQASRGRCADRS